MEAQRNQPMNGVVRIKPMKRKFVSQSPKSFQLPGASLSPAHEIRPTSSRQVQKSYRRGPKNDASPVIQSEEKLISDLSPDSSASWTEYMALRRKYLLLEEKSCERGKELREVGDIIKALEEEKLSLLDELVALEGLIHPLDIEPQSRKVQ